MMRASRQRFAQVWSLAWPAILEMLFSTAVTYADTAMVGRLGAQASASVGLTASVMWLVTCVFSAIGVGCVAYIARAVGAGQPEKTGCASVQALWLVVFSGIVVGVIAFGVHRQLPVWMNADVEIQAQAGRYFMIICLPMVFRAAVSILGAVLRGGGDTRSPMAANVTMNVANVVLNFFLIYSGIAIGGIRIPGAGLGVDGAAIATAISFVLGGCMMLLAVLRNPVVTPVHTSPKINRGVMGEILKVGFPVVVQRVISCMGYVAFASLVARLGTVSLAANSIAISAEELFYIAGYGVQSAAATLAGNALGEESTENFRSAAFCCTALTVGMLSATGLVLFAFPTQVMALFSGDAEVIALGGAVLRIVALSEPVYGIMIVMEGLFNGIGDTKAPVVFAIMTMWGIRIFWSALCILVFGLGLRAVWICMVCDNMTRALLLSLRYLRGGWKKRFAVAER